MTLPRRLERSKDRWIGGVCAGLAEFVGWHPAAIRALMVILVIGTFTLAAPIYLVLWWMMPAPSGADGFQLENFRKQ